jgi:cytochrome c peroxidase
LEGRAIPTAARGAGAGGYRHGTNIAENADPAYFDLGLCAQPGLASKVPADVGDKEAFVASLCGAFKVPTLRNVALTAPYMHNGYFKRLRDVVSFYVTRDTNPGRWYPRGSEGEPRKFNDLPLAYHDNVNTSEVPYDRHPGERPHLDEHEIDEVVAFLDALTDGYRAR